ncbi:hypothetical protein Bbelb_060570 [Branchiostoma belcheri]|nr:hypothetical protein Bbelb_060570 [Branchiostoma belcheri]
MADQIRGFRERGDGKCKQTCGSTHTPKSRSDPGGSPRTLSRLSIHPSTVVQSTPLVYRTDDSYRPAPLEPIPRRRSFIDVCRVLVMHGPVTRQLLTGHLSEHPGNCARQVQRSPAKSHGKSGAYVGVGHGVYDVGTRPRVKLIPRETIKPHLESSH